MKLIAFVVFFLNGVQLFGRIGETYVECVRRYGNPKVFSQLRDENGVASFEKSGISIIIDFQKGRAQRIQFSKDYGVPLDKIEIDTLLAANSGGYKWSEVPANTGGDAYKWSYAEDAKVLKRYMTVNDTRFEDKRLASLWKSILVIETATYLQRDAELQRAAEESETKKRREALKEF